jgi:hypothetical protein
LTCSLLTKVPLMLSKSRTKTCCRVGARHNDAC